MSHIRTSSSIIPFTSLCTGVFLCAFRCFSYWDVHSDTFPLSGRPRTTWRTAGTTCCRLFSAQTCARCWAESTGQWN